MLQANYKKEGVQHYLRLPCQEEGLEKYESKLLQYHKVPYFLSFEIRNLNQESEVYYRLKYRTSLKNVMGHLTLDYGRVKQMIWSIVKAVENADNYLLSIDQILWKSDYIFIEADTGNLQFCFYPDSDIESEQKGSLIGVVTELLQVIDRKEEDAFLYMLSFYNTITDPECDVEKIVSFCKEEKEKEDCSTVKDAWMKDEGIQQKTNKKNDKEKKQVKKTKVKQTEIEKQGIVLKIIKVLILIFSVINLLGIVLLLINVFPYSYIGGLIASMIGLVVTTIIYMNLVKEETPDEMMKSYFEEMDQEIKIEANKREEEPKKEVFHNIDCNLLQGDSVMKVEQRQADTPEKGIHPNATYGETTVLVDNELMEEIVVEEEKGPYVLAAFQKEQYPEIMIQSTIVIGRMKAGCNYILKEKDVSRMHAKICLKPNGELYVMDLNSKNGTFLNGERVAAGQEILLSEGDAIRFANCEFYLRR